MSAYSFSPVVAQVPSQQLLGPCRLPGRHHPLRRHALKGAFSYRWEKEAYLAAVNMYENNSAIRLYVKLAQRHKRREKKPLKTAPRCDHDTDARRIRSDWMIIARGIHARHEMARLAAQGRLRDGYQREQTMLLRKREAQEKRLKGARDRRFRDEGDESIGVYASLYVELSTSGIEQLYRRVFQHVSTWQNWLWPTHPTPNIDFPPQNPDPDPLMPATRCLESFSGQSPSFIQVATALLVRHFFPRRQSQSGQ